MWAMDNSMTQVKFTIDTETVTSFKARCEREGVSMASVIKQFMKTSKPSKGVKVETHTRPLRRKSVMRIIGWLNDVLASETDYRDEIPEQFEQRYEAADHACAQLSEAISCLEDAF